MKRSREERLRIGKEIYEKYFTLEAAAEHYDIGKYTARDYYREYKAHIEFCPEELKGKNPYAAYSREELISEITDLKIKLLISEGLAPVEAVHTLRNEFQISALCKSAGITRSWYYKWVKEQ